MKYAPFARKFVNLAQPNAANMTWNTAKHALQPANAVPMLAPPWRLNKTLPPNAVLPASKFAERTPLAGVFLS